ncbi:threonine/homoserine efflux transporter RhtA [Hydrogenispora ethanolica]|uniref:Threonine/homoserine efflux transporter RhtA n=1 Tax=Hydrogenispora ethanolica TaxID=1082276 RepID=A0A4R1SAF6_HYDET|nr:DMT family transporter [Hydrogenispora ethanolica]TCL76339.1 threonine/homoserine efflux transporter RhtA [Hydrogenispora ethanolica]
MKQLKLYPLLAILGAVLIWGFSFLSIKVTVAVIPPLTMAFIRFAMASFLLFWVHRWLEPRGKVAPADLPLLAGAGLIGITLYFYFENNGVKLITASAASIIIAGIPVLTLLSEALFFKGPFNGVKVGSVLLSVVGVYLLVTGDSQGLGRPGAGLGYLMMSGAALAWVIYVIITRPLFRRYSQLTIVCYQTYFGTLALAPFLFIERTDWSAVNTPIVWNLIFMGVCCSALAYYFYVYALDKLGANLTALFLNLIPFITVLAGWLILGEQLLPLQILGGLLVIAAVCVMDWEPPRFKKSVAQTGHP